MRPLLALGTLVLVTLACGTYITPTPTPSPTETAIVPTHTAIVPTATPEKDATPASDTTAKVIQAAVNIRQAPGGAVIGSVAAGDEVVVLECVSGWCKIELEQAFGYIWQGCLSDNPNGLGCEAE